MISTRTARTLSIAAFAAAFAGVAAAQAEESDKDKATIVVAGEGRATAAPDMAVLQLSVVKDAKTAREQLEQSLRRLRTDHLDLWQFHEIVYDNDPDWIFENGGAIETALKAREEGKIRYLGFTGHKDPGIHLKMLGMPY